MSAGFDADILIAGGGPVGLAAAASLAQAGFRVRLFERASRPPAFDPGHMDGRVYALSPASLALLDRLGAGPILRRNRSSPYRAMQVWQAEPSQALHFQAAEAGQDWLGGPDRGAAGPSRSLRLRHCRRRDRRGRRAAAP